MLELSEALARHSLIYLDSSEAGPRPRMLETIRVFVAERLAARPDAAQVARRHAGYYHELAVRADLPLRGAGQGEWLERLQSEAGNLAIAVSWHLAHDRGPLPHLFRVLWLFWEIGDHMGEARAWVGQLMPAVGSLGPQARAELLWAAVATANEVHDDPAALAASQHLALLLPGIKDPFLHTMSELVMAWTSPIAGDLDSALRAVLVSLEVLRGHDEPYWTAVAALSASNMETAVSRYDDALHHVHEARQLVERFGYSWLAAWLRVQLGTLDIVHGRLDRARELLEEAMELSLTIGITRNVTLCLVAFARLALAEANPGRAALLAGAVEGLRQRAGLGAWPMLRRWEAELAAQIRQALGTDRFDQGYEAGARLSQRQAVATARNQPDAAVKR